MKIKVVHEGETQQTQQNQSAQQPQQSQQPKRVYFFAQKNPCPLI